MIIMQSDTFELLYIAALTTEYFHVSYTVFEYLLKKFQVIF
jgi:hypothetical protein